MMFKHNAQGTLYKTDLFNVYIVRATTCGFNLTYIVQCIEPPRAGISV